MLFLNVESNKKKKDSNEKLILHNKSGLERLILNNSNTDKKNLTLIYEFLSTKWNQNRAKKCYLIILTVITNYLRILKYLLWYLPILKSLNVGDKIINNRLSLKKTKSLSLFDKYRGIG